MPKAVVYACVVCLSCPSPLVCMCVTCVYVSLDYNGMRLGAMVDKGVCMCVRCWLRQTLLCWHCNGQTKVWWIPVGVFSVYAYVYVTVCVCMCCTDRQQ